jgi:hypothetical protein
MFDGLLPAGLLFVGLLFAITVAWPRSILTG